MTNKPITNGDESTGIKRRTVLKRGAAATAMVAGVGTFSATPVAAQDPLDELCEAVPLDVMLVLDRSGSMGFDPDGDGNSKLDDLKAAANNFVDRLSARDRVGLTTFGDGTDANPIRLDHSLTDDFSAVQSTISGLTPGGGTDIGGGVDTGHADITANGRSDATPILVVQSNGLDNTGLDPITQADEAKADGIRVLTIALGEDADDATLQDMASDPTSDNFFDAPTGVALEQIFEAITEEICPTIVDINIKPGSDPNAVNCRSKVVPVAVLTDSEFDATRVDPSSLRFGAPSEVVAGDGAEIVHDGGHFEDAVSDDGTMDGDTDFVGHFATADTGFDGSQDEGWLVGKTMDGEDIAGRDSVKLVGCNGR